MAKINFYHLTTSPLEKALPKLMEKVYQSGAKSIVLTENEEQTAQLNKQLWTYTTKFFLPHGSESDGFSEKQPIYLTSSANENPNQASILAIIGRAEPDGLTQFDKCLYLFNGNVEDEVSLARARWKSYKNDGHELAYWQQNEKGGWEQAA
jgi:DNA polymerase-3 subunit chi